MTTEPYTLTKIDIAALRQANRLIVHFNQDIPERTGVRLIKENRPTERDPFAQDIEHHLPAPVTVHNRQSWSNDLPERGVRAFGHIYLYPPMRNSGDMLYCNDTIISLLRAGDRIRFRFDADGGNCGFIVGANLHADALYLIVERGDADKPKRLAFVLDHSVCLDNSARMVRGIPVSDQYKNDRERVRKAHGYEYSLT